MELYIGVAGCIIGTIVVVHVVRKWVKAKADTVKLIDSMMANAEQNLGHRPDAASMAYLANHPFLSAKIWEMLAPEVGHFRDTSLSIARIVIG